jgi:L-2,4-diaminobutyric acid acetyltransferase
MREMRLLAAILAERSRFHEARSSEISIQRRKYLRPAGGSEGQAVLCLRSPVAGDGAQVAELIRSCPPLDPNSLYCTLLQCTHFSGTCAIALVGERVVGWLSAYRLPDEPDTLFVWQVAVAEEVRGAGLASHLLEHILARDACRSVACVKASVAPSNAASLRMFQGFAARRGARLEHRSWLDRDAHFQGRHESEPLIRIAPLGAMHSRRIQG